MYSAGDLRYCEEKIKNSSKGFYRAFSKLPTKKARAIFAVYAFCREADDLIDVLGDTQGLYRLKEDLDAFKAGITVDKPIWRSLRVVFDQFPMDISAFYDMIEGQGLDVNFKNIQTQKELEGYCYYVAGTVGLMILPILATKNHLRLRDFAIDLGKAMQITNILRDIGEDLNRGRIYIPSEIIEKYNYSYDRFNQGVMDNSFISLWEHEAAIAEELYSKLGKEIQYFDRDSQFPVMLASNFYRAILASVRENNYNCFHNRNYISYLRKLRIMGQTWLDYRKIKIMEG